MTRKYITLGEACEKGSSNIMQKDLSLGNGPYKIYGASGLLGTVDFYTQEKEYIGIVKDGAGVGRAMLLPEKSSCIGTMQYLIPKEHINVRFLFYAIESMNLAKYNTGATIPHIYFKDYKKETLPLFDLQEQAEIVRIFDKIRLLVASRQAQLKNLDELVKSQFIEMFENKSYKTIAIGELVEAKIESAKKKFKADDDIRYVDISSIDNKLNEMTGFTLCQFGNAPSRAQQCLREFDIVVSTVRPNLRNIAMNHFQFSNIVASSGFCVLRAKNCNPQYLFVAVLMDEFSRKMSSVTSGANYPAVKDSDILSYEIPCPPIELQNEFARFVEQTDKSKNVYGLGVAA